MFFLLILFSRFKIWTFSQSKSCCRFFCNYVLGDYIVVLWFFYIYYLYVDNNNDHIISTFSVKYYFNVALVVSIIYYIWKLHKYNLKMFYYKKISCLPKKIINTIITYMVFSMLKLQMDFSQRISLKKKLDFRKVGYFLFSNFFTLNLSLKI